MYLSKFSLSVMKANMSNLANASKGMAGFRSRYTLPDLPYEYSALEPVISSEIMKLHHQKHHATYVQNLNAAEEKMLAALQKGDLQSAIALQGAVKFNGGGHINHSIFWNNLAPKGGKENEPRASLSDAIKKNFGDLEAMKKQMSQTAVQIQGSGWAWLGYNPQTKRLQIVQCPNQDPLESTFGLNPLLGIDVWEHAYYLQYKNVRADYVKEIWNIINWKDISDRYETESKK